MFLLYMLFPVITFAVKYEAEPHDSNIYSACSEYPDLSIEKVFDVSNFNIKTLSNGSFHVFGSASLQIEPEEDIVSIKIEIYKKVRGSWINTIYNIHRSDACKSIFSKSEIWYKYLVSIPAEQRKCPIKKGMQYTVDVIPDFTFDLPDRKVEGDYKVHAVLTYGASGKVALCFDIDYALYRI